MKDTPSEKLLKTNLQMSSYKKKKNCKLSINPRDKNAISSTSDVIFLYGTFP